MVLIQETMKSDWKDYITRLKDLPPLRDEWELDLLRLFDLFVAKNSRLIELGCSNARWVKLLMSRQEAIEGYGFDMDSSGFHHEDITYIKGDVRQINLPGNHFDFVFSIGLVEHFFGEEFRRAIDEHARICKPNGIILICVPTLNLWALNYYKIRLLELTGRFKGAKHFRIISTDIRKGLLKNDCTIILEESAGWLLRWRNFRLPRIIRHPLLSTETIIVARKGPQ